MTGGIVGRIKCLGGRALRAVAAANLPALLISPLYHSITVYRYVESTFYLMVTGCMHVYIVGLINVLHADN